MNPFIITGIIILSICIFFKFMHSTTEEELHPGRWIFGWMKFSYFRTLIKFMKSYETMDTIHVSKSLGYGYPNIFSSIQIICRVNNETMDIDLRNLQINHQKFNMCLIQYFIFKHYVHKIRRYIKNSNLREEKKKAMENMERVVNSLDKSTKTNKEKEGALSIS